MKLSGITFDIPGIDRDCQVYLFWKKNEDSSEIAVNPGDFQEDAVQKWKCCLNFHVQTRVKLTNLSFRLGDSGSRKTSFFYFWVADILCYFMLSNFPEELFPIGSLFPPITLGVFQSANLNKSSFILKCIRPPSFIQRGRIISDSNGQHSKMHSIQSLTHERMLGRQSVMGLLIMEDMGSDQWY